MALRKLAPPKKHAGKNFLVIIEERFFYVNVLVGIKKPCPARDMALKGGFMVKVYVIRKIG
jgi:hypothetical protein